MMLGVPDDAGLVYVAWARENNGHVNVGSELGVLAAPLPSHQVIRLCDHLAVSSGTLATQLAATPGTKLTITAEGQDAEEAIKVLRQLVEEKMFDEPPVSDVPKSDAVNGRL